MASESAGVTGLSVRRWVSRCSGGCGLVMCPAVAYQDWLKQNPIESLNVGEARLFHELAEPTYRHRVVPAAEHTSIARSVGRFRGEVHPYVVLVPVPLPHLNGQEPIAGSVMLQTVRSHIRLLALDACVVPNRVDRDPHWLQTAVAAAK